MKTSIEITPEDAVEKFLSRFPDVYSVEADSWKEIVGIEVFFRSVWGPFGGTLSERFIAGEAPEALAVLAYIETLMCDGTEELKNAVATWFLDCVMGYSFEHPEAMRLFMEQLGSECKIYCRGWNEIWKKVNLGLE